MFGIRPILVLAFVVVVFLFAKRLPQIGRALGESIRGFKKGLSGKEEEPKKVDGHDETV